MSYWGHMIFHHLSVVLHSLAGEYQCLHQQRHHLAHPLNSYHRRTFSEQVTGYVPGLPTSWYQGCCGCPLVCWPLQYLPRRAPASPCALATPWMPLLGTGNRRKRTPTEEWLWWAGLQWSTTHIAFSIDNLLFEHEIQNNSGKYTSIRMYGYT